MKNLLSNVFVVIFLLFVIGACEKEGVEVTPDSPSLQEENASDADLLKSSTTNVIGEESMPVSDNGVTPYIIEGENPGGNRTCDEVEAAWDLEDDYFFCGEKIDYDEDDGSWDGKFPEGLDVTVNAEEKELSFSMEDCITIDGKSYKVGAVIVKGGRGANVYFYEEGTLSDAGLGAPGGKFQVSNVTFCFVGCEEIVIAVKSFYWLDGVDSDLTWALSEGSSVFDKEGTWCDHLGINYYPGTSEFDIKRWGGDVDAGNVTIEEAHPEGVHSLIITVDLNDGLVFDHTYLYVGSLSGLTEGLENDECPKYVDWPYQSDESNVNTHEFTIPFAELN